MDAALGPNEMDTSSEAPTEFVCLSQHTGSCMYLFFSQVILSPAPMPARDTRKIDGGVWPEVKSTGRHDHTAVYHTKKQNKIKGRLKE